MSIHDKIRDQLYGGAKNEAETERSANAIGFLTDSADRPASTLKTLYIALAVDAFLAVLVIFAPNYIASATDDGRALGAALLVPFGTGFIIAFTLYKMIRRAFDLDNKHIRVKEGVMSGFSGHDERLGQFTVWFVAAGGGVANLLGLYALSVIF